KLGFTQENNTIDSGELDIGRRATQDVPPGIFWRSQVFIDQPQFLKFNISLQKDALIGVYGRKGLPPSHTQYDFVELLDGSRLIAKEQRNLLETERAGRQTRSVSLHEAGFIQYLDAGIWHLAFYNDGKNAEQVSFNTIVIVVGRVRSVMCLPPSALTLNVEVVGFVLWALVPATLDTKEKTVKKKSALLTAVLTVSAWVERVDVKKVGLEHLAIKEHAILGVLNMELVKMESVNATKAGMASTAQLVC
ncbi:hypothetical protein Chor_000944, partial [Crotalus horridus]